MDLMNSYQARIAERNEYARQAQEHLQDKKSLQRAMQIMNQQQQTSAADNAALQAQLAESNQKLAHAVLMRDTLGHAADNSEQDNKSSNLNMSDTVLPPGYVLAVKLIGYDPNRILGLGSSGTVVYKGCFGFRDCAVKKMNISCSAQAKKEIDALLKIDDHMNVVKYHHVEENSDFIFIALELCDGSLENLRSLTSVTMEVKRDIVRQALEGVLHLHKLHMSHRDIKPANILYISKDGVITIKVADLGFARQLESSTQGASIVARSTGWQPAEVLQFFEAVQYGLDPDPVLPKLADIFSMGLLIFIIFSGGVHPFGGGIKIESNIMDGKRVNFDHPTVGPSVRDLVRGMIHFDPHCRTRISDCLRHPALWDPALVLEFLKVTSDAIMGQNGSMAPVHVLKELQQRILPIGDWRSMVDRSLFGNRKYSSEVSDLLRLLRNKEHHFGEVPEKLRIAMGNNKLGVLDYFLCIFPHLFIGTFQVMVKYYCTVSSAALLNKPEYVKQQVGLSNAVIHIPQLNPFLQYYTIKFVSSYW